MNNRLPIYTYTEPARVVESTLHCREKCKHIIVQRRSKSQTLLASFWLPLCDHELGRGKNGCKVGGEEESTALVVVAASSSALSSQARVFFIFGHCRLRKAIFGPAIPVGCSAASSGPVVVACYCQMSGIFAVDEGWESGCLILCAMLYIHTRTVLFLTVGLRPHSVCILFGGDKFNAVCVASSRGDMLIKLPFYTCLSGGLFLTHSLWDEI